MQWSDNLVFFGKPPLWIEDTEKYAFPFSGCLSSWWRLQLANVVKGEMP